MSLQRRLYFFRQPIRMNPASGKVGELLNQIRTAFGENPEQEFMGAHPWKSLLVGFCNRIRPYLKKKRL